MSADLEAINEAKVNGLLKVGVSMPVLQLTAMQTRLEVLIDYLFEGFEEDDLPAARAAWEDTYEAKLSEMLDGVYAEVTAPRLFTPGEK